MTGSLMVEVSNMGVAVSADVKNADILDKMEILHAVARALKMSHADIVLYTLAESRGVFIEAETVLQCETQEQMSAMLKGEQPEGTVINLTELEKQKHES